jgi:hypothetical protein
MSIIKDPVQWSSQIAKTKFRVFLFILVHFAFITWGLYSTYKLVISSPDIANFSFGQFLSFTNPLIYFIGVGYPAMYLYVIYRLLKMMNNTTTTTNRT